MICHECFGAAEEQRPAVGLCTSCSITLCRDHLAAAALTAPLMSRYACQHTPGVRPASARPTTGARFPRTRTSPLFECRRL